MNKYKQCVQIGGNVTDIMRLPCVFSCHKMEDGGLEYLLYDWDDNGQYVKAHYGDWLCEGHDGVWSLLSDDIYQNHKDDEI